MSDEELERLISDVRVRGWIVWSYRIADGHRFVKFKASPQPPGFDGLADSFAVPEAWSADDVLTRLFCNLQYLQDHELREGFTVAGRKPFDPHAPVSLTGAQKDWFVEQRTALEACV